MGVIFAKLFCCAELEEDATCSDLQAADQDRSRPVVPLENFRRLSVDLKRPEMAREVQLFLDGGGLSLREISNGLKIIKHYPPKRRRSLSMFNPSPAEKMLWVDFQGEPRILCALNKEDKLPKFIKVVNVTSLRMGYEGCPQGAITKTLVIDSADYFLAVELASSELLDKLMITLDYLRYCASNGIDPQEFYISKRGQS